MESFLEGLEVTGDLGWAREDDAGIDGVREGRSSGRGSRCVGRSLSNGRSSSRGIAATAKGFLTASANAGVEF